MQTKFSITNPNHNQYKNATLELEFEENAVSLKKLHFYIDNLHFYAPMQLSKNFSSTWLFQKPCCFIAPSKAELDLIQTFSTDIINHYALEQATANLIAEIKPQTELYSKIKHSTLTKNERNALIKEFRSKNHLIRALNRYRFQQFNNLSK